MSWLKYRHKFASGYSRTWEYVEIPSDYCEDSIENFIEDYDLCSEYNWSDKYRGIDYDIISIPPREHLEWLVIQANRIIKNTNKRLEYLDKLIEKHYGRQ